MTRMTLSQLHEIVNPLFQVGGSVRDQIMGFQPNDFDFATPLTPDEVQERVHAAGWRTFNQGARFGTIGVVTEDVGKVEITTFRAEVYSPKNRRPTVEYVSDLYEDLTRRDFTINAMATRNGEVYDPFSGQDDIKEGIIRAVGNPRQRFKEDPLRMLRACRFAAKFAFLIEEDTYAEIKRKSFAILDIPVERWMPEMDAILLSDNAGVGLMNMMTSGLMKYMIPEISLQSNYNQNSPYHQYDLWIHTLLVVMGVPAEIDLRWAALLHDVAKPFVRIEKENPTRSSYYYHAELGARIVEKTAYFLKWSRARREVVQELVANHMQDDSPLRGADKNAH